MMMMMMMMIIIIIIIIHFLHPRLVLVLSGFLTETLHTFRHLRVTCPSLIFLYLIVKTTLDNTQLLTSYLLSILFSNTVSLSIFQCEKQSFIPTKKTGSDLYLFRLQKRRQNILNRTAANFSGIQPALHFPLFAIWCHSKTFKLCHIFTVYV